MLSSAAPCAFVTLLPLPLAPVAWQSRGLPRALGLGVALGAGWCRYGLRDPNGPLGHCADICVDTDRVSESQQSEVPVPNEMTTLSSSDSHGVHRSSHASCTSSALPGSSCLHMGHVTARAHSWLHLAKHSVCSTSSQHRHCDIDSHPPVTYMSRWQMTHLCCTPLPRLRKWRSSNGLRCRRRHAPARTRHPATRAAAVDVPARVVTIRAIITLGAVFFDKAAGNTRAVRCVQPGRSVLTRCPKADVQPPWRKQRRPVPDPRYRRQLTTCCTAPA